PTSGPANPTPLAAGGAGVAAPGGHRDLHRLDPRDAGGLPALVALGGVVADLGPVLEHPEALPLDHRIVDEYVLPLRADDKSEPLAGVEPLHDALRADDLVRRRLHELTPV